LKPVFFLKPDTALPESKNKPFFYPDVQMRFIMKREIVLKYQAGVCEKNQKQYSPLGLAGNSA